MFKSNEVGSEEKILKSEELLSQTPPLVIVPVKKKNKIVHILALPKIKL